MSDEESHISSRSSGGSTTPRRGEFVAPGCNAGKSVRDYLDKAGFDVAWTSGDPGGHPLLRVSRIVCERRMFKHARAIAIAERGAIHNVAPNPAREVKYFPAGFYNDESAIWHSLPIVHPNDVGRAASADRQRLINVCRHRFGECSCRDFAVLTSSHAVYYASDADLISDLLNTTSKTGFVVLNRHIGVAGERTFGEGVWRTRPDGMIEEQVVGNTSKYVHPHTARFFSEGAIRAGGWVVSSKVIYNLADTYLLELTVGSDTTLAPEPPTPEAFFDGATVPYGDLTLAGSFMAVTLKVTRMRVFGTAAVVTFGDRNLDAVISTKAVATAATHLTARVRDAAFERDCDYYVRRSMTEDGTLRALGVGAADCISATTAFVMTYTVHRQAELRLTVQDKFGPIFGVYNAVTSWQPVSRTSILTIALLSSFGFVSVVLTFAGAPWHHHLIGWALLSTLIGLWGCFLLALRVRNSHLSFVGDNWVSNAQRGLTTSVQDFAPVRQPLLGPRQDLPPVDPDTVANGEYDWFSVGVDPHPPKRPGQQPVTTEVVGIQPSGQLPLAVRQDQEAEVVAIKTRILKLTPIPHEDAYERLLDTVDHHYFFTSLNEKVEVVPTEGLFRQWMSREHLSAGQRASFEKAHDALKREPLVDKDFSHNLFVKAEKTLDTSDRDGGKSKKPRAIQALSDRLQVFISPQIWAFCRAIRKFFDGSSGLLFASSRDAVEIGEFFREHRPIDERSYFFVADYATYDACLGSEYYRLFGRAMSACGVDSAVVAAWSNSLPRGQSRHGVKYSASKGLVSGRADTNDGGSFYNAVATTTAITEALEGSITPSACSPYHPIGVRALAVLGDDNSGVVTINTSPDLFEVKVRQRCETLGLTSDFALFREPWQFEFASHIILPVVRDGSVVWKMSPKPGRALVKLGSKMKTGNRSNLAADVASVWQTASHVPFLRKVLQRLRVLLAGVAPRGRPYVHEHRFHSTGLHPLDASAWTWVHARYGLCESDEELFELWLNQHVVSIPCVVEHPILDRLIEVDVPK